MKRYLLKIPAFGLSALLMMAPSTMRGQGIEITSGGSMVNTGASSIEISNGGFINNGTYTKAGETFTFSGTTASGISGSSHSGFYNLTITNTGGVEIVHNAAVTVGNILSNPVGAGGLIIRSTTSGSGSLIHSTANIPATVERYLAKYNDIGDQMFHFLSSPVAAQAIRPEFVSNEATIPAGTDFYSFAEATNEWINTRAAGNVWNTNFEPNLVVGKGYLVAYPADVTKNFAGTLNTSEAVLICTNTATPGGKGWNLLGNPFPSAIDWTLVTLGDGMDNALYYYDNAEQNYRYYLNPMTGDLTSLGSGQQYIPAMQGFMVHAKETGTKTVTLPLAARTHQGQDEFYKSTQTVPGSLSLKVEANDYEDVAFIHFNQQATPAFDGSFDAFKLRSYSDMVPMIYTKGSDGNELAINGLPEMAENTVVPVYFEAGVDGNYILTADLTSLPSGIVYLEDTKLNKFHNLTENPVYNFEALVGDRHNRFLLTFGSLGIDDPISSVTVQIYAHDGHIYLSGISGKTDVIVTDLTGRVVQRAVCDGESRETLNAGTLSGGIYVVSLISGAGVVSCKILL